MSSTRRPEKKPSTVHRLDELLDREQAVRFLAERLPPTTDRKRAVHDRIGKQIDRAIANQSLIALPDGRVALGGLVRWAQTKKTFGSAFAEIPVPGEAAGSLQLPRMNLAATAVSLPPTLAESHQALIEMSKELHLLREQNRVLLLDREELERYRARDEARTRAAKANGRKGGIARRRRRF